MICPLCFQRRVEDQASMFCRICEAKRLEIEARRAAQPFQGIALDVFRVRELTRRFCPWEPDF